MPPPQEAPVPKKIEWNRVTWYSGTLAVLLFVALVCGAFYFGTWYQKQATPIGTKTIESQNQQPISNVPQQISDVVSRLKVAKEIPNGFDPGGDKSQTTYLVMADSRDLDNKECGGRYDDGPCYFFVKSGPAYNWPSQIWTWTGTGMDTDSIKFISKDIVQFNAHIGDAGMSTDQVWQFDLGYGSSTLISSLNE